MQAPFLVTLDPQRAVGIGNTQCIWGLAAQNLLKGKSHGLISCSQLVLISGEDALAILNCFTALSALMQAKVISRHCNRVKYPRNQEKYLEVLQGVNGLYRNAEFFSPHIIRRCLILFFSCLQLSPHTCVYPSPQLQSARWHVRDHDLANCCHQIQRHFGNLISMFGAIPLWQATHHHIGITNGFHLMGRGM